MKSVIIAGLFISMNVMAQDSFSKIEEELKNCANFYPLETILTGIVSENDLQVSDREMLARYKETLVLEKIQGAAQPSKEVELSCNSYVRGFAVGYETRSLIESLEVVFKDIGSKIGKVFKNIIESK